jgi:hypothetical protein
MPLRVCWEVLSMYGTCCKYRGAFLLEEQCIKLWDQTLMKSKVQQGPFLETMFMIRSMIMSLLENCMAYGISLSLSLSLSLMFVMDL